MASSVNRRDFLRWMGAASTGLLAAACSSAAPSQPAAAPPTSAPAAPAKTDPGAAAPKTAPAAGAPASGGQADWDALVEAAKKEGKVTIQTAAGAGYREGIDQFMKAFPGIEAEQQAFPDAATYVPKIKSEREAGIYSIDVATVPVTPLLQIFKPEGVTVPIKQLIIRPDALDDKAWHGGFESRWADSTKSQLFRHQINVVRSIYINTDLIKEDDIKSLDDLLDPKWKGKIVTSDVTQGYVYTPSVLIRDAKGEDWLKKLFVDQEPMMIRDRRQAVETLIRGGAPIGFGLNPLVVGDFVKDGLANHIKNPEIAGAGYSGGDVVAMYDKAPHPKAAALFINWLLSKDGQQAWSTSARFNSARTDIPFIDPSTAPGRVSFPDPTQEEMMVKTGETQEFLKKIVT